MKYNILIFLFVIGAFQIATAQPTVKYGYDKSGNRMTRTFTILRISKPSSAKDSLYVSSVSVGPNPNEGIFQVRINGFTEKKTGTLKVYDLTGKLMVEKSTVNELNEINLTNLADGIYILDLLYNNEQNKYKIIKSH